ncbi:transcription factor xanC [Aspergillus lucknowensis]|uniref:BZIP domain-containing protein n=1 Tax=Aspergillus lucknowensis TaxID=176173 RepID=A0ABR4L899_9EURO
MPSKHVRADSQSQKQDPTERRRLQNRLSQRNHRRKIRDRIAKPQERVIASELRAAATPHGWHSVPCIPYEVKPSPSSTSSSLSLSPPASSPAAELQCPPAPACSSYNLNINPMASLCALPTQPIGASDPAIVGSGGFGPDTLQMCEQWGLQGSIYLATETSLPQILQTLGPSSNAIILVPMPVCPTADPGVVGYTQDQGLDMAGVCQCQSLGWMSCPLHLTG